MNIKRFTDIRNIGTRFRGAFRIEKQQEDPRDILCLSSDVKSATPTKSQVVGGMIKNIAVGSIKTALFVSLSTADKIGLLCMHSLAGLRKEGDGKSHSVSSGRNATQQARVLANEFGTFPSALKDSIRSIEEAATRPTKRPGKLSQRLETTALSQSAENLLGKVKAGMPYQKIDETFMKQVKKAGWQGQTILAGGTDIEDQSILTWMENGNNGRTLNLTFKLTQEGHNKLIRALNKRGGYSTKKGAINRLHKKISQGSLTVLRESTPIPMGKTLNIQLDGMTAHYNPLEKFNGDSTDSDHTPYSSQGKMNITIPAANMTPDEIKKVLDNLSEFGIDTHLSTPKDLEYLYLRKMLWSMGLQDDALMKSLSIQPDLSGKMEICKDQLSRATGIEDVTKIKGYDWTPKFSSLYRRDALSGEKAGRAYWERFDADTYIDNELKNYSLAHTIYSDSPAQVISRIIESTGSLLSTENRFNRLGMPVAGISSNIDRHRGGASYVFTHLTREPDNSVFVLSKKLLRRCDQVAFPMGVFGRVNHNGAVRNKVQLSNYNSTPLYEVMFKDSVSLLDYLEQINVGSEMERVRVLASFAKMRIKEVGGKPVEEIVKINR